MSLTKKQRIFIDEYLQCWNATEAARRSGYSEKTAYSIGWENLRKPEIEGAIRKRLSESAMSAEEVLMRLGDMARADVGDFLSIGGLSFDLSLKQAQELGITHLIKKVKQRTHYTKDDEEIHTIEIELHDAQAALVHLGRHFKLFTDRQEVVGDPDRPIRIKYDDFRADYDSAAEAAPISANGHN